MPAEPAAAAEQAETFRPGSRAVQHVLVGGLLELALASVCLGVALEVGEQSAGRMGAQTSLGVAAALWLVLGLRDLVRAGLRARVLAAELDGEGVTVRGATGAHRWRYDQLSEVRVRRSRTSLVTRDGGAHRVAAVSGPAQGERFKARVLARAAAAMPGGPGRLHADRLAHGSNPPAPRSAGSEEPDRAGNGGDPP